LHETVTAYGIKVIPFIAGDLDEIIQAFLEGKLERDEFAMPGCCGRGRRQGQDRMRRGRMGGPDVGACVCPNCGCREPHERAFPCVEKLCPKCGTPMARECLI
jgi:predicted Fe-Mo cluster-binding NifX family protein